MREQGLPFRKYLLKIRDEIVSLKLGKDDLNPGETTAKYITAEELHKIYTSGEEFYVVDMRNDYEHVVGYFEKSTLMPITQFS